MDILHAIDVGEGYGYVRR